mgnify:CR=1 FL=1
MKKHVLTQSSVWGDVHKARGASVIRASRKRRFAQQFAYPMLDHSKVFAWRLQSRRGPSSEYQTLIVAYPYKAAVDLCNTYNDFVSAAKYLGLRVFKETCLYRGNAAYRIVVADRDVDVEAVMAQLSDVF